METFTVEVEPKPPFNFELTVHKPAGWDWLAPYEFYSEGTIWSAIRLSSGRLVGIRARSVGTVDTPKVSCEAFSKGKLETGAREELFDSMRRVLAANEDLTEFYEKARRDATLSETVRRLYGMRDTPFSSLFSGLILAVTLHMAPLRRSRQMMDSLIHEYGEQIKFDGKTALAWPSAETIARASVEELEEKCKLGYRAKNLKLIVKALVKGFPSIAQLSRMSAGEAKRRLMELPGIGEYSAEIVSPYRGFPLDVLSVKFFHKMFFGREPKDTKEAFRKVREHAATTWGRWMGYAFVYVLNDLQYLSKKFGFSY